MNYSQFENILLNPTASQSAESGKEATDSISAGSMSLKGLESMSVDDLLSRIVSGLVDFAIHLALAVLVFYVGKFIINKIYKLTATIFIRRELDRSLATFVLSLVRIVLYFILIVTVIGILGIETSSFLAIFASAGVAIGLALSGTLQNFAGGVLILLLKPYKIGDYIEAQGYAGTVNEIQIFSTIINTPDNKQIIIPNGGLSTGSINNYSKEDYRRVDWTISVSYGDDIEVAKKAILDILLSDDRVVKDFIEDDREMRRQSAAANVLTEGSDSDSATSDSDGDTNASIWKRIFGHKKSVTEKLNEQLDKQLKKTLARLPKTNRAPFVALSLLNSSSIDITARAWTRSEYYWPLFFEMNERFYKELPQHGLSFPFPQMDVHLDKLS
ncbi:MAG: mechanosensitive ion channel [Muribaculum sp.]|nr:mechanosensitive ion channel [Muribaculum sp.]